MVWKVIEWIYTPLVMALMGLYSFIGMLVALLVPVLPVNRLDCQSAIPRAWSRALFRLFWAKLEVEGLENYDPGKPCIIVSNHQSHLDIPVLFLVLSGHIRMVAKAELFKIPIFGTALGALGQISVDRGSKRSAREGMKSVGEALQEGVQIWLAPEGTRSKDGKLGEFKSGAFRMALQAKVPMTIVVISGTRDVLPKSQLRIRLGKTVRVRILKSIPANTFEPSQYKEFQDYVKTLMSTQLALLE